MMVGQKTAEEEGARRSETRGSQPDPPSLQTLAARRREAEATLEAIDAQQRAAHDAAEAADAQERAAREGAGARTAELRAELDRLDRYVEEERQREYREWSREYDRRQDMMRQLHDLANAELPHVPRSMEDYQADLAQLDAYLDRAQQAERDRDRAYIDRCESRRLWDRAFAARWALHHPEGLDGCSCTAHRHYRGEA